MYREFNFSLASKFNGNFVYDRKCWTKCLIYKLKFSMCDAIHIGNTHQTKKNIDGHFSDILRLLKNRQISD